jgi:hypothetical protein
LENAFTEKKEKAKCDNMGDEATGKEFTPKQEYTHDYSIVANNAITSKKMDNIAKESGFPVNPEISQDVESLAMEVKDLRNKTKECIKNHEIKAGLEKEEAQLSQEICQITAEQEQQIKNMEMSSPETANTTSARSNYKSLIDDYADVNAEQPGYTDPDD